MPDVVPPEPPASESPLFKSIAAHDAMLLAGGLVLFLVLLYEMHVGGVSGRFLTPPLVAVAGIILIWPVRKLPAARAILLSGAFLISLWFIDQVSGVLIPFFVVYVLAFFFDPLVQGALERFRIPRWVTSLLVTAALVGACALFILLLVPKLIAQVETLAVRVISLIGSLRDWVLTTSALDLFEENFRLDKRAIIGQLSASLEARMAEFAQGIPLAAQRLVGYIGSLLGLLTTLTLVPVLLFYTLKDYPYIKRRLVELFPLFGGRRDYLVKAGGIVGNYLRGQITISAIAAFNVSVALLLFKVPFALLIGLAAGVLNLIPNIGVILTNILGVALAVMFGDPWVVKALTVFFVLLGESLLEQAVLVPRILGNEVGLHPVLIILSLLVFGYFLGLFGLLIAVPATALIMTIYKAYRDELKFELMPADAYAFSPGRLFRRRGRKKRSGNAPGE